MSSVPEGLQNVRTGNILNAIDRLRHIGVGKHMNITVIVVIGDQSTGKSSVLEAIANIKFPQSKGTCTLFPTEIVMRRDKATKISISLVPDAGSPGNISAAKKMLEDHKGMKDLSGLPKIIEELHKTLGLVGQSGEKKKLFSKHTLRIEISGPNTPQLTLVDLPGLIQSPARGQTKDDVKLVREIASSYVKNPRAIVLAIISATTDVQNQSPWSVIEDHNASKRALGIVTKLDMVDDGDVVQVLSDLQSMGFGLGWHALRNRKKEEEDCTLASRDDTERVFFEGDEWNDTDEDFLGIANLRTRLASALYNHLAHEVPLIVEEINAKIATFEKDLARLGPSVQSHADKQQYLIDVSARFIKLATDSLEGHYDGLKSSDMALRLRALLEEHNQYFAGQLLNYGAKFHFQQMWEVEKNMDQPFMPFRDGTSEEYRLRARNMQKSLSRDEAVVMATEAFRHSRGRELVTSYSPGLVKDLYEKLCTNWTLLASQHVLKMEGLCKDFFAQLLKMVTTEDIARQIKNYRVHPALNTRRVEWNKALEGIMRTVTEPPNTQNPNFVALKEKFTRQRSSMWHPATIEVRTALEGLDAAQAYYEIQLSWFIDSITKVVIGDCLLRDLAEEILSPKSVIRMTPDFIDKLIDEDEKVTKKRTKFLKNMTDAVDVVKQLQG